MSVSKTKRGSRRTSETPAPEPALAGRVCWLLAAAVWTFLAVSIGGFNIADWPSSTVGVYNSPISNPGGEVGAAISWWAYASTGLGAWLILSFGAIALGVLFTGRSISHPFVRTIGVMLAAVAFGGLQHAWMPTLGPIPGMEAGLIPGELDTVLSGRFGGLGTSLILMTTLILGLLVAADEILLAARCNPQSVPRSSRY